MTLLRLDPERYFKYLAEDLSWAIEDTAISSTLNMTFLQFCVHLGAVMKHDSKLEEAFNASGRTLWLERVVNGKPMPNHLLGRTSSKRRRPPNLALATTEQSSRDKKR